MALAIARGRRRRALLVGTSILVLLVGGLAWRLASRVPIAETRRFLTEPVKVGNELPPPPPAAAGPAEVERRYAAAAEAFGDARYEEAAADFAWVAAQDPRGPHAGSAEWNLTRSRLRSGDATGALAAFRDLVGQHADYLGKEVPGLRTGLELMERGNLPAAEAAFGRMLHDQPDSEFVPVAHLMLGRIHWMHGRPLDAVREFGRLFASVKDPVPGYANLARELEHYARGDTDVPETFDRLARQGDTGFRDIYQYLAARSLLEQDRFQAAETSLEELRRRYPEGDFSHIVDLEHAWNLLRHAQAADALAVFQRLEQTAAPERTQAFDEFFDLRGELPMGIARCQLELRHYPEAVAAFERALAAAPHGMYAVEHQVGLAAAYEGTGQLDRSAALLRTTIAEHPDEPDLWALRQQLARVEARLPRTQQ